MQIFNLGGTIKVQIVTLQTLQLYSTLKRRENERFHVISTWNTRGVFVYFLSP